jgi:hypothetical protein
MSESSAESLVVAPAWQVVQATPMLVWRAWLKRSVMFWGGKMAVLGPSSGESEPGGSHSAGIAALFGIELIPDMVTGAAEVTGAAGAASSVGLENARATAVTTAATSGKRPRLRGRLLIGRSPR